MKVCIIGAGAAGITAAKALHENGIGFDWFEKGSELGGLWKYNNDSGTSSAYRSLQIDTSSRSLAFPDFSVPGDWPTYLQAAHVLEYLQNYAAHFGIADALTPNTTIESVIREGSRWRVRSAEGDLGVYDALVVANGHLTHPRMPEFDGEFSGRTLHSHDYREPEEFSNQHVLVVGMGNSACDIATDLARVASQVTMATRRSAWILPKYLMGVPTDRWSAALTRKLRLPTPAARGIINFLARRIQGPQERFGIPKPTHPIWREHATIGQELLPYAGYGWIEFRPTITRLDGKRVELADGSVLTPDAIIYATGYRHVFPFLTDDLCSEALAGRLYRRIEHPQYDGLFFSGLIQPVGSTIRLVEAQARWIAARLSGSIARASHDAIYAEIDAYRTGVAKRYVDSERYLFEVDGKRYLSTLTNDGKDA
ncbi:flavin-containing monooxygenase [Cumulibacter soli]|uniref:flavin-containing monooxygenase n=1 Tax=Cumulibacter soli TaxID=2546344 RepID=UPI00106791FF|nr:NAD(P)-binding domain-containing protein [Cumulibacter soli]